MEFPRRTLHPIAKEEDKFMKSKKKASPHAGHHARGGRVEHMKRHGAHRMSRRMEGMSERNSSYQADQDAPTA